MWPGGGGVRGDAGSETSSPPQPHTGRTQTMDALKNYFHPLAIQAREELEHSRAKGLAKKLGGGPSETPDITAQSGVGGATSGSSLGR